MSIHWSTSRGREEPPERALSMLYIMFVRKKLRREDFLFENGWFDSMHRGPGELQMQQFQISDC